jgi:hypothetical protein
MVILTAAILNNLLCPFRGCRGKWFEIIAMLRANCS